MRADIESNCACAVADLNIAGDEPTELPRRLEAENIDLPVIYVTADDSERNRAWVQSVGGCGLFRKPVDDQALIDAIRWAIERHKPTH
jgi:FixJ family two-component response regulator